MKSWWLTVALVAVMAVGCNKSSDNEVTESKNEPDPSVAAESKTPGKSPAATGAKARPVVKLPVKETSEPAEVVDAFLKALKTGDKQVAEALLTTMAYYETSRHNLQVEPPGTPEATYKIGRSAVAVSETGSEEDDGTEAQVETEWTEKTTEGETTTEQVLFVLRHETAGWRVAGMCAVLANEPEPTFLNFEDPPEMFRVLETAAAKVAEAEEKATKTAKVAQEPKARQAKTPTKVGTEGAKKKSR